MNSNSYLGLGLHPAVIEAEEAGSATFGAGPGAVRFISGSYSVHLDLERDLANFHGREAAMVFSSAYGTIVSVLTAMTTAVAISCAWPVSCRAWKASCRRSLRQSPTLTMPTASSDVSVRWRRFERP